MNKEDNFGKYMLDIQNCWKGMAIMAGATIVISAIYIFLLKWITKPLLYVSIVLIAIGFLLLGAFGFLHKDEYDKESNNYKYAFYGGIGAWVVGAIYIVIICCCWTNISLGASIMEAASDFVS